MKRIIEFVERLQGGWMRYREKMADGWRFFLRRFRIRKLTPRECGRLMGVSDCDIDKMRDAGISDSQMYKMFGNSIVVNVLEGIFTQMFRRDSDALF